MGCKHFSKLTDLQWMYYWQKELFAGIYTSKKSSDVINISNTVIFTSNKNFDLSDHVSHYHLMSTHYFKNCLPIFFMSPTASSFDWVQYLDLDNFWNTEMYDFSPCIFYSQSIIEPSTKSFNRFCCAIYYIKQILNLTYFISKIFSQDFRGKMFKKC